MSRYKYFDLNMFVKACIVTVLMIPVGAVLVAAVKVWCNK